MFNRGEIRQNLMGCLEIALFMPKGAARFCATYTGMKKSFLIPLLLLPLSVTVILAAHPNAAMPAASAQLLMLVYTLRLFVYLGLFLGMVYMMAKRMDREENFYRFVVANNWLALPATILGLPLVILFLNGAYTWADIYPLMVFITLYSYAYTAFMATYVMRMPWELACFVAIAGMAIHQTSLDVLKWAAVQAVYLIA